MRVWTPGDFTVFSVRVTRVTHCVCKVCLSAFVHVCVCACVLFLSFPLCVYVCVCVCVCVCVKAAGMLVPVHCLRMSAELLCMCMFFTGFQGEPMMMSPKFKVD